MNWSTFSWKILTTSLYVTPPSTDMVFIFRMFYSNFMLSWERRLTVRSPLGNKAYTDFKTRALRSNRGTSSSTGYASMRWTPYLYRKKRLRSTWEAIIRISDFDKHLREFYRWCIQRKVWGKIEMTRWVFGSKCSKSDAVVFVLVLLGFPQ